MRIEDDVVVTQEGCEVMSDEAPVEPSDIEMLVGTSTMDADSHPINFDI